ncbi:MAG: hypothetical protein CBB97_07595 [Candidatus Endolissoclinum sp. TMED37]|nr:MAG: hypothetical protein CBB97_07595 [Candidatus Endolissoclinum sp. TMED37]
MKNYIFSIIDQTINILGGFLFTFLLIEFFGTEMLGVYNSSLSFIGIISVILGFGLNVIIEKKGTSMNSAKINFFLLNRLLVNIFIFYLIIFFLDYVDINKNYLDITKLTIFYGLFLRFFALIQSGNYAMSIVKKSVYISIFVKLFPILVLILSYYFEIKISIDISLFLIFMSMLVFCFDKNISKFISKRRQLFIPKPENFYLSFDAILEVITRRVDFLIAAVYLQMAVVGIFSLIIQLSTVPWIIFVAINRYFLSESKNLSQTKQVKRSLNIIYLLVALTIFLVFFYFLMLKVPFIKNFKFIELIDQNFYILIFFLFAFMFEAIYRILRTYFISKSHFKFVTFNNLLIMILKILISFVLINDLGILAFGISAILSHVPSLTIITYKLFKNKNGN